MACFTNGSLVLSVGAVGDICSGRGQCISNQCACDPYWTGRADLITLEGQACQNPEIFDRLMWAFAAAMHFKLFVQGLPIVLYQYQQFKLRRRASRMNACSTFPAVALIELFALPALVAIFVTRAATTQNFGVDLPISVCLPIVFTFYLYAIAFLETTLFKHLMVGTASVGTRKEVIRIVRMDAISIYLGTAFYSAIWFLGNIGPVFLPIGDTPARIALMAVRNVGTILYFGWYWLHHSRIKQRILAVIDPSSSDHRLNRALAKIESSIAMARTRTVLMFILYALFTVCPPLYSFQYFISSLMLGLACGGNHILMQLSSGRSENKVTNTSDKAADDKIVAAANSAESNIVRQASAGTNGVESSAPI